MNGNFLKKVRHPIRYFVLSLKLVGVVLLKFCSVNFPFKNLFARCLGCPYFSKGEKEESLRIFEEKKTYNIQCTVSNYFT